MKFKIKKDTLTLGEVIQFVNDVVSSAFNRDEDGSLGEYSPILKEIAMKYYFVKYFTDYKLSDDMEENYEAFASLDLYGAIYDSAAANQYLDLAKAVDEKINQINQEKCAYIVASGLTGLADGLLVMIKKVGEVQDAQLEVAKESEKLVESQLKQTEFMNAVASHFTDSEYAELIKKQGDSEYNVEDIVNTVVKTYLDTGIYNARLQELKPEKHEGY